jgi:prepilin-type N-terminal cleavage/methylation domain-containing protein
MTNDSRKAGFTLIEVLVAFAIIVAIMAMIYGSFRAISKSTRACETGLSGFQQVCKILDQMAAQIRCAYAATAQVPVGAITATLGSKEKLSEDIVSYFEGDPDNLSGDILHFVTTHRMFAGEQTDGLFDVTYKFDKNTGALSVSQRQFVGTLDNPARASGWRVLAENVESVDLAFFDGQKWLPDWVFKGKRRLPRAVKISITCEDENSRQYYCEAVADVYCQNGAASVSLNEAAIAVDK